MTAKKNLTPSEFALGLRCHRERLGITQDELSKLLDVSFEAVSKWERQLGGPSQITMEGAIERLRKVKSFPRK